ncbi:uncharacterized protein LOC105187984 [Harpegnathos saltator]|uniref:uncharacterized protein LOC105187984 n=1 Tax=Harpegnathos saltator TaxID=610380 RepID=UPI00058F8CFA|nr:uncharacterized protein LOC105187984 [Harpegnathos saltator]
MPSEGHQREFVGQARSCESTRRMAYVSPQPHRARVLHLYSAGERHDRAQWGNHKRTVQISHAHLDVVVYKRADAPRGPIKSYEMSRSVVVPLVLLALSQAAFATTVDVSKTKTVELQFTDEDIVPKTELKNLVPQTYANGFIGDLEIGSRLRDETIFQRIIVFNNPTDYVQSSELKVNGPGIVHYINAQNFQGSYAVVCDHSDALGSSRIYLTIRVNPQTKSRISLFVALH